MDYGYCDHAISATTEKFSYSGPPYDHCKAILKAIQSGGQIVITKAMNKALLETDDAFQDSHKVSLGTHIFQNIEESLELIQCLPCRRRPGRQGLSGSPEEPPHASLAAPPTAGALTAAAVIAAAVIAAAGVTTSIPHPRRCSRQSGAPELALPAAAGPGGPARGMGDEAGGETGHTGNVQPVARHGAALHRSVQEGHVRHGHVSRVLAAREPGLGLRIGRGAHEVHVQVDHRF